MRDIWFHLELGQYYLSYQFGSSNCFKVDWTFELLWDPLLTISPNLFFLKRTNCYKSAEQINWKSPMGVKRFTDRWKCLYFSIFAKNEGKSFYFFILKKTLQLLWFFIMFDGS